MQRVARFSELGDQSIVKARLGETDIVLIRDGGEVHALAGTCPHAGAPLEEGAVCNGRLVCPWHKASFRIATGALLEPPALDDLTRYQVHLAGDDVFVDPMPMPAAPAPARGGRHVVVVVGSGAAGVATVVELRRAGFDGRVVLAGPEADRPYDRTALSKFVLSGEMAPGDVAPLREDAAWVGLDVERWRSEVTSLDTEGRVARLSDGRSIAYDSVVIATGAQAKHPDMPGAGLAGVHVLRDRHDAAALLASARAGARVVVIGSSFIGLEAASAFRKRGLPVSVVSPETVPFARQFGEEIGAMFRRLHEANGVVFHLGEEVECVDGETKAEGVRLKSGLRLPAEAVLLGVGVTPATDFVTTLAKSDDGAIITDVSLRAADGVYAAGDCARFPYQGRDVRIEHWRLAQQHAHVVAHSIMGADAAYEGVPFFWTYHYGERFEYLGHPRDWERVHVEGDLDAGKFLALQIRGEQVVGVIACGRETQTALLIERMRGELSIHEALASLA